MIFLNPEPTKSILPAGLHVFPCLVHSLISIQVDLFKRSLHGPVIAIPTEPPFIIPVLQDRLLPFLTNLTITTSPTLSTILTIPWICLVPAIPSSTMNIQAGLGIFFKELSQFCPFGCPIDEALEWRIRRDQACDEFSEDPLVSGTPLFCVVIAQIALISDGSGHVLPVTPSHVLSFSNM
jgi:hypothetical protein